MKVDINAMEDAAGRMYQLGAQLYMICAQLNETRAKLRFYMQDSNMVSDQILTSLSYQVRELDQRSEGAARMSDVLQHAAEEYRICEQRSIEQSREEAAPVVVARAVITEFETIPKAQERLVYERYIAPFIKFEKREYA